MDGLDLFRKLGAGARFDFKRFHSDAERLKVIDSRKTVAAARPLNLFSLSSAKSDKEDNKGKGQKRKLGKFQYGDKGVKQRKFAAWNSSGEEVSDDSGESDAEGKSSSGDEGSTASTTEDEHGVSDTDMGGEENNVEDLRLLGNMRSQEHPDMITHKRKLKKKNKQMSAEKLQQIKLEQISHFRHIHHIHVWGTDVPDPVENFDQLCEKYSLHPKIIENLKSVGFMTPTPIQMQAATVMMHKREILACAPTGSGKTAAFILPILQQLKEPRRQGFRALVLSPTRELAKQTYREFCRLSEGVGIRVHFIEKASTAANKFGPSSSQKFDVLVTTPNRLVYMLQQDPPIIQLHNVEWLVVDESDKLFEEGKRGFRDQLATIYKACDSQNIRRAMFSATFAYEVEEWCRLNLDNVVQVYIGARNAATQTIEQELVFVGSESGKMMAMRTIIQKGLHPPVLIFVQSKDRAKELFHELIYDGINVDVIHSDRTQLQRDNVVRGFRSGRIWVLICTELMGRGIDFKGVNLVINYDFPTSAVSYIHRIGRTGRAGRAGKAITFFTEDDKVNLRSIANVMKEAGCPVPEYMLSMKRPNKKKRRKLAQRVPERESIRTGPPSRKEQLRRKKQMKKGKKANQSQDQKKKGQTKVQKRHTDGQGKQDQNKGQKQHTEGQGKQGQTKGQGQKTGKQSEGKLSKSKSTKVVKHMKKTHNTSKKVKHKTEQ